MSINTLPESKKYYTQLSLSRYQRDDAFKLTSNEPNLVVQLPLPTELRDDTTVGYSPVNLETVGDIINKAGNPEAGADVFRQQAARAAVLRNAGNILQAGIGGMSGGFKGIVGDSTFSRMTSALGGAFFGTVQSLLPPEQVSSAIQQSTGIAPNPNPSVAFQGPVLRDFTMTWAFYPKKLDESRTIDDLIRKLKARALPTWNSSAGTAVLNYPSICQINFFPWDSGSSDTKNGWTDRSIIQIKKCFMSGVNVNYNAFGTPSFFEGNNYPTTIQLTISFKEIEYLTAEDWESEYAAAETEASTARNNDINEALGNAFKLFGGATGVLAQGIADVVGADFVDFYTESERANAETSTQTQDRLNNLPADGSSPLEYTLNTVTFGGSINSKWVVQGAEGGKFTVTETISTIIEGVQGGGQPTTKTFNSREELDTYMSSNQGPLGNNATLRPLPATEAQ